MTSESRLYIALTCRFDDNGPSQALGMGKNATPGDVSGRARPGVGQAAALLPSVIASLSGTDLPADGEVDVVWGPSQIIEAWR
jgi:hypothetical protein